MKTYALTVTMAVGMHLGLSGSVQAFSVRDITVQSRRGEPFRAAVRLNLEGQEQPKDIDVTIGDQKAYQGEALSRPALLNGFKVTPVPGKRDLVRITSEAAVDTPNFDLLLLARSGQITIMQHYPVKLAKAAPRKTHASKSTKILPETPASGADAKASEDQKAGTYPDNYGPVERGATLYGIVRALQVPNDKIWHAAVVIWRANKPQFSAGNIHGLPVGMQLRIPKDLDEQMAVLKAAEAQEIISEQWDEWAALLRMGTAKRQMILAAAQQAPPELPVLPSATTNEVEPQAPQTEVTPVVPQAVASVSATDLQTLLQGLEERIMKRLTPTVSVPPAAAGSVAVLNTAELHTTLQTFEERLTQRVQHMLAQGGGPVPVMALTLPSAVPSSQPSAPSPGESVSQVSTTSLARARLLMFGNVLWVSILGVLSWRWFRRRGYLLPHKRA